MESENNEYVSEIREWGLIVEELKELRKAMEQKSLAQVMKEKGEQTKHDELIEG